MYGPAWHGTEAFCQQPCDGAWKQVLHPSSFTGDPEAERPTKQPLGSRPSETEVINVLFGAICN